MSIPLLHNNCNLSHMWVWFLFLSSVYVYLVYCFPPFFWIYSNLLCIAHVSAFNFSYVSCISWCVLLTSVGMSSVAKPLHEISGKIWMTLCPGMSVNARYRIATTINLFSEMWIRVGKMTLCQWTTYSSYSSAKNCINSDLFMENGIENSVAFDFFV